MVKKRSFQNATTRQTKLCGKIRTGRRVESTHAHEITRNERSNKPLKAA
jgi:hypothetical protein